jgi:hypothetical protein
LQRNFLNESLKQKDVIKGMLRSKTNAFMFVEEKLGLFNKVNLTGKFPFLSETF